VLARFGTIAIVGVGLIGGSIGLALRARGLARRVIGIGRSEASLTDAERAGAIDAGTTDQARGVAEAEIAVVCTPVTRIAADVANAAEHGPDGILITDAGSTKRRIVERIEQNARARAAFVGAHPIAGSERQGIAHARADLFEGRVCVLTPTEQTPADRLPRARLFWDRLGCRVREMTPQAHDDALALTSHLPHAVAAALAASVPAEFLPLTAGAFRDCTRIAASDPALWTGIFCDNRLPILRALNAIQERLSAFQSALQAADESSLRDWLNVARERRRLFDTQVRAQAIDGADGVG
jgi:prephenate dehydrogenase